MPTLTFGVERHTVGLTETTFADDSIHHDACGVGDALAPHALVLCISGCRYRSGSRSGRIAAKLLQARGHVARKRQAFRRAHLLPSSCDCLGNELPRDVALRSRRRGTLCLLRVEGRRGAEADRAARRLSATGLRRLRNTARTRRFAGICSIWRPYPDLGLDSRPALPVELLIGSPLPSPN